MQAGIADVPAGPEAVKATPVKRPTPNSGKFTINVLTVKAESKKLEVEAIKEAVAWCEAGNGGAAKAAKKFGIPRGKLGYALDKGVDRRTGESILTAKELHQLAKWVTGSARNINPAKPSECSSKVVSILKARKHFNRAKKFGRGCIPLTAAEEGVLERGRVSETWLSRTFIPNHPEVQSKKAKSQDAKRVKNQREEVVEEHFEGEFGLRAELKDAGNLDPETGEIKDSRRLINIDEMPQFLDYTTGVGQSFLGERGVPLQIAETQNRETATIDSAAHRTRRASACSHAAARAGGACNHHARASRATECRLRGYLAVMSALVVAWCLGRRQLTPPRPRTNLYRARGRLKRHKYIYIKSAWNRTAAGPDPKLEQSWEPGCGFNWYFETWAACRIQIRF
jgi:hypothetical protein